MENLNTLEAYLTRMKSFAIISKSNKIPVPIETVDDVIREIKEIRELLYGSQSSSLNGTKVSEN
jgi:hypothetical protein